MSDSMRRHDLVYLQPNSQCLTMIPPASASASATLFAWLQAGRPMVVTRQAGTPDQIQLAAVMPAHMHRQRLAGVFSPNDFVRVTPPLAISDCLNQLDDTSSEILLKLERAIQACGAQLGVYGSLAWETLSKERYRHADSDIDIICDIQTLEQVDECLAELLHAATLLPCRLDGELRLANAWAVSWRELAMRRHDANAQVLVKGMRDVQLMSIRDLLASIDCELSHA